MEGQLAVVVKIWKTCRYMKMYISITPKYETIKKASKRSCFFVKKKKERKKKEKLNCNRVTKPLRHQRVLLVSPSCLSNQIC